MLAHEGLCYESVDAPLFYSNQFLCWVWVENLDDDHGIWSMFAIGQRDSRPIEEWPLSSLRLVCSASRRPTLVDDDDDDDDDDPSSLQEWSSPSDRCLRWSLHCHCSSHLEDVDVSSSDVLYWNSSCFVELEYWVCARDSLEKTRRETLLRCPMEVRDRCFLRRSPCRENLFHSSSQIEVTWQTMTTTTSLPCRLSLAPFSSLLGELVCSMLTNEKSKPRVWSTWNRWDRAERWTPTACSSRFSCTKDVSSMHAVSCRHCSCK